MSSSGMKKQYRPPQEDANTFETQHEFLESLQPVPIESVDEIHRKCPHCWKRYGESDPGLDNAEEPVRFRCNHVFGEKCMKDLFGLPEPVRVDFAQLSFSPGTKGAELGRRLSAYVDQCGVDKSALLIGGRREKDFAKLLAEMQNPGRGMELLGKEWYSVIQQAMYPQYKATEVHLMENAVIIDLAPPEPKSKASFEIPPAFPVAAHFGTIPTNVLGTGEAALEAENYGQNPFEAAKKAGVDTDSDSLESEPADNSPKGSSSASQEPAGHKPASFTFAGSSTSEGSETDSGIESSATAGSVFPMDLDAVEKHLDTAKQHNIKPPSDITATQAAEIQANLPPLDANTVDQYKLALDSELVAMEADFVAFVTKLETQKSQLGAMTGGEFAETQNTLKDNKASLMDLNTQIASLKGKNAETLKELKAQHESLKGMKTMLSLSEKKPASPTSESIAKAPTYIPSEQQKLEIAASAQQKLDLEESKLKVIMTELKDPSLAPYIPFSLFDSIPAFGGYPTYSPGAFSELLDKAMAVESEEAPKVASEAAGDWATEGPEELPGAWKDVMPEQSNLDKLVALQKKQEKAKNALKTAQKAKAAQQAHQEMAQKRAAKAKEEREARAKELIAILARTFTKIYEDYEQFQFNAALAAGQPPPVKKLKLAPSNEPTTTPAASESPPPVAIPPLQNIIHLSATIHRQGLDAKHYEVPQPYIYNNADLDDSYEDEEVDDSDGITNFSNKVFFLTRTLCSNCLTPDSLGGKSFYSLPDYVFWKDAKSVPDGCPICQSVLFKKNGKDGAPSGLGVPDDSDTLP